MNLEADIPARALILALMLAPASAAAQQDPAGVGNEDHLDSLVLVLNLISTTHARPATGVVLAGDLDANQSAGTSWVLVSADFVAQGDEIIVLDGGNDINRNARSTRTVARSAEAGLALLEVEGLQRSGVAISMDPWGGTTDASHGFAAWPGAEALAEGAALLHQPFTTDAAASLPQVSGPVFDGCGNLAGFHLHAEAPRLVENKAVSEFLAEWEVSIQHSPCADQPDEVEQEPVGTEHQLPEATGTEDEPSDQMPEDKLSTLALTASQKWGLVGAWIVLLVAAMFLYVRRQKKKEGHFVVLERKGGGGQALHRMRLHPGLGPGSVDPSILEASFEHQGESMVLTLTRQGLIVSRPEDEGSETLGLAVAGTPCLAGERFLVTEGQELQLGGEVFTVKLDIVGPPASRKGQ